MGLGIATKVEQRRAMDTARPGEFSAIRKTPVTFTAVNLSEAVTE